MHQKDPMERVVEILVLAPVGAGLLALESAPGVLDVCVARARAELERRQEELARHVTSVRSTGEVALAFGFPKLRARVDRRFADARQRIDHTLGRNGNTPPAAPTASAAPPAFEAPPLEAPPFEAPPAPSATVFSYPPRAFEDAPGSDTLPIPGYDALSASQVVERLAGLQRDELDAVHAYEAAHRGRRTILGKIEQLAG